MTARLTPPRDDEECEWYEDDDSFFRRETLPLLSLLAYNVRADGLRGHDLFHQVGGRWRDLIEVLDWAVDRKLITRDYDVSLSFNSIGDLFILNAKYDITLEGRLLLHAKEKKEDRDE